MTKIIYIFWFYLTHILEISRFEAPISRFLGAFLQTLQICVVLGRLEGLQEWMWKFHADNVSLPRSGQPFWLVVNLFQPIRSTTQIWGSETSSVWKFCTCSLDGISWGNQWWRWGASSGQNTMKVRWDGPAFESYWFFTCSSTTLIYNGLLLHRYLSARAHSGMLSRAHTMLLVQCRWPLTFWVGRG